MKPWKAAIHAPLEQLIKDEARRLGFVLAGVTTPDPLPHIQVFDTWLAKRRHGSMNYLADTRSRGCRADPRQIMPECRSILVLAAPYSNPSQASGAILDGLSKITGRIAAYAWGKDYHIELSGRMRQIVSYIEQHVGHPVANKCYTDAVPLLERELAQRAGLGWIGKNTCLINPKRGSYLLIAEILLNLELEPDPPFDKIRCGTCTRCIQACPTACILDDHTLDASRCISYLTIELKGEIPNEFRAALGEWVFGCDLCQMVCPWNRFAPSEGDPVFHTEPENLNIDLLRELALTPVEFKKKYFHSPIRRTRYNSYLRNISIAIGNQAGVDALSALATAATHADPIVQKHTLWAISQIQRRSHINAQAHDRNPQ